MGTNDKRGKFRPLSEGQATEDKQDAEIVLLGDIKTTLTTYNYIQSEETATYKYYGFANATGWQIKRKTLTTGVWEVASETGDYATAWADRAGKTYNYA